MTAKGTRRRIEGFIFILLVVCVVEWKTDVLKVGRSIYRTLRRMKA